MESRNPPAKKGTEAPGHAAGLYAETLDRLHPYKPLSSTFASPAGWPSFDPHWARPSSPCPPPPSGRRGRGQLGLQEGFLSPLSPGGKGGRPGERGVGE